MYISRYFLLTEPIPYYDFGSGSGPVVFSNVACIGWENNLSQCAKDNYMMIDCPPNEVAGVFCADCECSLDVTI